MFLKERTSFLAAMLFAVHPIHTEAVSWNTSLTLASDVDIALSCGSFHQYASLGFSINMCVQKKYFFCFRFELLWAQLCRCALYQWRAEKRNSGHTFQACLWCQWCRLLGTKWQHSQSCFFLMIFKCQLTTTKNRMRNQAENLLCIYCFCIPFLSVWPVILFDLVPL